MSKLSSLLLILIGASLFSGCKKEVTLPIISTSSIADITTNSALSGGVIISDGGASITSLGVCWAASENPTISDSKTVDMVGSAQFVSNLSELNPGSTYHVRAYATNSVGTAYGADLSFVTLGQPPTSVTLQVCCTSSRGATLNGTVNPNNLPTTVTFEYGINTNYGSTINSSQNIITGNQCTSVSAVLTGLNPETTYHFRVVAVNSLGTFYGNDCTFTTPALVFGFYMMKMYTDDLYFINLKTNLMEKVADVGVRIPFGFTEIKYRDDKLYIFRGDSLLTYNLNNGELTLILKNSTLGIGSSFNSTGELYTLKELSDATQGSLYKFNITNNTSTKIGTTTGSMSILGMMFDSSNQLWAVDEFAQRFGLMNTQTGTISFVSATFPYTDMIYLTTDNEGYLYTYNVGTPTGIIRYDIANKTASLFFPIEERFAGLDYGPYYK